MFANPKVTPERMLAPHQQRTVVRMQGQRRIFAGQETGEVNDTSHPATQGLGLIGADQDGPVGRIMHSTLAMTAAGVPLGLLTQEIWAREAANPVDAAATRRRPRRRQPIAANESGNWVRAVQATARVCRAGMAVGQGGIGKRTAMKWRRRGRISGRSWGCGPHTIGRGESRDGCVRRWGSGR